jgi:hypothetical protein
MNVKTSSVTGSGIKRAIESRDGRMLASFYADDAVVRVIPRRATPFSVLVGKCISVGGDDLVAAGTFCLI